MGRLRDIAGATNSTYTLVAADVNEHDPGDGDGDERGRFGFGDLASDHSVESTPVPANTGAADDHRHGRLRARR